MPLCYTILLLFLLLTLNNQGCQRTEPAFHQLTQQDLQSENVDNFKTSEPKESTELAPSPLNQFATPGVLENITAKPLNSGLTATQPSENSSNTTNQYLTTTSGISASGQNTPMLPGSGNPPLTEVVVTQSYPLIPKEIKLLIPEKSFETVGPEQALKVSYDDIDLLKVLNMDPVPNNAVDYFPDWLKQLDGKRVRIRGFMFPPSKSKGITYFSLARDTGICCFGPNGKVYDLFGVKLRKGVSSDYLYLRPFDVVGVFHIDPDINQGHLENIYYIDDAVIIP